VRRLGLLAGPGQRGSNLWRTTQCHHDCCQGRLLLD
jgi:hypothetical protein